MTPDDLVGLLRGPAARSLEDRLALLREARPVVSARDNGLLVGLAAVTRTGVLVEVRPSHRDRGIEAELARRVIACVCHA
jgi:hypothetical protein